jgi:putative transposase
VPKDTYRTATTDHAQFELPEQVTLAVAELGGAARLGLLALAVGTGLQVLQTLMAEDVARLVGAKGRHNPDRTAVRHGSEPGQVTLGGRRVRIPDPGSAPLTAPASCPCRPTRRSRRPTC